MGMNFSVGNFLFNKPRIQIWYTVSAAIPIDGNVPGNDWYLTKHKCPSECRRFQAATCSANNKPLGHGRVVFCRWRGRRGDDMFIVPGAISFTKYGELLLGICRTSLNVFSTDVNIGVRRRRFNGFEKPASNKIKNKNK